MNYTETTIKITPYNHELEEIIIAELSYIGFDSFDTQNNILKAYIRTELFDKEKITNIPIIKENFQKLTISVAPCNNIDWNLEWEKQFDYIVIEDCVIKAPFHNKAPKKKYNITLMPKMAFGTGHHETTSLIVSYILQTEMTNKSVLDMGTGTGILAILCSMKKAKHIDAFDIDEWSYKNAIENISNNKIENITVKIGDKNLIQNNYDIIVANINRSVLLKDIKTYAENLNKNGMLFISGFYKEDIEILKNTAKKNHLTYCTHKENNNWAALSFLKEFLT